MKKILNAVFNQPYMQLRNIHFFADKIKFGFSKIILQKMLKSSSHLGKVMVAQITNPDHHFTVLSSKGIKELRHKMLKDSS